MATIAYSGNVLHLAKAAYERSKMQPSEAVVCLILAAASVEAFFNEMVAQARSYRNKAQLVAFADLLGQLDSDHARLGTKLKIAHFLFQHKLLDAGRLPYQDYELLVTVRNSILHMRPDQFSWAPGKEFDLEPNKLVKRLTQRKIIKAPPPRHAPFLYTCLQQAEVARWAYNTAVKMIKYLIDLAPASAFRSQLSFQAQALEEIKPESRRD